jgi:hypothetical protein
MTADTVPGEPASWRDDAACLEHPAEWFTGPHQPGDTQRAIEVCNTCPVKRPCLDAALKIARSPPTSASGAAQRQPHGAASDASAPAIQWPSATTVIRSPNSDRLRT